MLDTTNLSFVKVIFAWFAGIYTPSSFDKNAVASTHQVLLYQHVPPSFSYPPQTTLRLENYTREKKGDSSGFWKFFCNKMEEIQGLEPTAYK